MENKEEFTLYHMKKKQAGDPSIRKLPTFDMDTCITEYIRKENIDLISERAAIEVPSFLEFGVKRGRATVAEFFVAHKRRRSDIQFNILSQVHDIVKSQCASSASVERSFSEQALIQTPRRRRLKYETVNNLMMIKCNLKFLQRQHKEEDLREYLFNNNPIDSLLNK